MYVVGLVEEMVRLVGSSFVRCRGGRVSMAPCFRVVDWEEWILGY